MTYRIPALALAAVVGAFATGASAQTLGEQVASGRMSEAAFEQLIVSTGLTPQQASGWRRSRRASGRWPAAG